MKLLQDLSRILLSAKLSSCPLFSRQFLKYCLVGASGTIIAAAMLYILTEYCKIWYMLSYILGVLAGMVVNYLCNKYWTFKIAASTNP